MFRLSSQSRQAAALWPYITDSPYPSRHNSARFPVNPLMPQNMPVMYASFLAKPNTESTRLPNNSPSSPWLLYAVTVLNALSFSSAV